MPANWVVWLALQQASMATIFLLACSSMAPRLKLFLRGMALWCGLQVVDEVVAGNFFSLEHWEYLIFGVYVTALHYFSRVPRHGTDNP